MRKSLYAAALVLVASGCSASGEEAAGTRVAAAFYPLQYVAERVAGEHAQVDNLTAPGKDSHELELTIRETATITSADLVIHLEDYQPAIDEAVEQNSTGTVIEAAGVVGLMPLEDDGPDTHQDEGEHDADEEQADEESHTADDGHDHDGDLDPHFWLDPLRMADLGDAVATTLADLDPAHAEEFASNAAALRTDLEQVDADYTSGLADCERSTVVVSHDAFGYLERYGLEISPVAGLSPDAEPTVAGLARLQDLIVDDGVTTVFNERLASSAFTESLADDAGVGTAVLDPIEGLTDDTAEADYLSLMGDNLRALTEANGCT